MILLTYKSVAHPLDQAGHATARPALERLAWSALTAARAADLQRERKYPRAALSLGPDWRVYTDEREGRACRARFEPAKVTWLIPSGR
jgi:hypothetical protein